MLADTHAGHGGVDGWVVGAGLVGLRVAEALRVKRVRLSHATAEPNRDDVLCFAASWFRFRLREKRVWQRQGGAGLEEVSAIHESGIGGGVCGSWLKTQTQ